jgi:hypoxanthine phosphoribosyltransferase
MLHEDIAKVYFTADELKTRVHELGETLSREYTDKHPLFVSVLKGSFIFMADLMRELDIYCDMDFMTVSSYGSGTTTTGAVKIIKDLSYNIENRHIILVEDILDSGVTLSYLKNYLSMRNPASIRICTLLDKPSRRKSDITADYVGFLCPDDFIVGYGLDYDEKYRNLPYIGGLKPEVYA